jgi:hypothetical protein
MIITDKRSARGAAAFTQVDETYSHPANDVGGAVAGPEKMADHSWDSLIDDLLRILHLEDNWDGEGTEAPDPALTASALQWAQTFKANRYEPAARVMASVNGTVYFEWDTPHFYREVEITSPIAAESRWVSKDSGDTYCTLLTLARRS